MNEKSKKNKKDGRNKRNKGEWKRSKLKYGFKRKNKQERKGKIKGKLVMKCNKQK